MCIMLRAQHSPLVVGCTNTTSSTSGLYCSYCSSQKSKLSSEYLFSIDGLSFLNMLMYVQFSQRWVTAELCSGLGRGSLGLPFAVRLKLQMTSPVEDGSLWTYWLHFCKTGGSVDRPSLCQMQIEREKQQQEQRLQGMASNNRSNPAIWWCHSLTSKSGWSKIIPKEGNRCFSKPNTV